jgi:hypothetical protein
MPIVFARRPMIPIRRINYVRRGMGDAAQCASVGGTWNGSVCLANSPGVVPQAFAPVDFTDPIAVVRAVEAGNPQALAAQAAYNAAAKANPAASSTAAALIAGGVDPYLAYLQTTGKMSGGDYNISPTGTITPVANPLAAVSFTPPPSTTVGTPVQSNAPSPAPVPGPSTAQSNAPNAQPVSQDVLTRLKNAVSGAIPVSGGNWIDGIPNWAVLVGGGLAVWGLAGRRR